MVKINPVDFVDRNPAFESAEDVHDYMKVYDKMKKHGLLAVNTDKFDSDLELSESKIRCETYLINAEKLLEEYGQFIDFSKVDYTYDQMFQMQEEALTEVQETSADEIDWVLDVYHGEAFRKFSFAMIQCLQASGLSVMSWEMEEMSDKACEMRHSYCEEDEEDDENYR